MPFVLGVGCATTPQGLLDRADAETQSDKRSAIVEAGKVVGDARKKAALRIAAAMLLGRLRASDASSEQALHRALETAPHEGVRCAAAWALGQMSGASGLEPLVLALERSQTKPVRRYVLQAILRKSTALLEADFELEVRIAKGLNRLSALSSTEPEIPILARAVRSLEVDTQVLKDTSQQFDVDQSDQVAARLYAASLDLFGRIEGLPSTGTWRSKKSTAISVLELAYRQSARPCPTRRARCSGLLRWTKSLHRIMTLYWGRLAASEVWAPEVARVVLGSPAGSPSTLDKLLLSWVLMRAHLYHIPSRRALSSIFATSDAPFLRFLDRSRGEGGEDILQRVLAVEVSYE